MTDEVLVIEWLDAVAGTGWELAAGAEHCSACTSIGYLVVEDDKRIVLAGTWGLTAGKEMETNNRMTIPKGWIKNRKTVKLTRKRAAKISQHQEASKQQGNSPY